MSLFNRRHSRPKPTWFPTPNTDCLSHGPLAMGCLISNPFDPEDTLSTEPIPIPESKIKTSMQINFEETRKKSRDKGASLWLKFLESAGFEASGSSDKSRELTIKCDKLETRTFLPDDEYVIRSLAKPEVQQTIARDRTRRLLYMVIAVKIAHGATIGEAIGTSKRGKLFAGVDGSAVAGMPAGVGSTLYRSSEDGWATVYTRPEPFVFVYRLRQIRYKKGALTDHKLYGDAGALYGVGKGGEGEEEKNVSRTGEQAEAQEAVIFLELDEDDVTADDVEAESVELKDWNEDEDDGEEDGGDCELVVPRTGQGA